MPLDGMCYQFSFDYYGYTNQRIRYPRILAFASCQTRTPCSPFFMTLENNVYYECNECVEFFIK